MKLSVKQLRKLVNETILEDSQLLSKWASKSDDPFEQWLAANGMTPIPRSNTSSRLGSGAYAIAYEVEKNGKRCVAKFVPPHEVEAYKKVKSIRDGLPSKYSRNILEIYEILDIGADTELYGDSYHYEQCVVVEYLVPLSKNVVQSLWTIDEMSDAVVVFKNRMNAMVHGSDTLKKLISYSLKQANIKTTPEIYQKLYHGYLSNFSKMMSEINSLKDMGGLGMYMKITDDLKKVIENTISQISNDGSFADFVNDLYARMLEMTSGDVFPRSKNSNQSNFKTFVSDKELVNLYSTLKYLSKNFEFNWNDLHHDNVMLRQSDKAYVVSDVGCFT